LNALTSVFTKSWDPPFLSWFKLVMANLKNVSNRRKRKELVLTSIAEKETHAPVFLLHQTCRGAL